MSSQITKKKGWLTAEWRGVGMTPWAGSARRQRDYLITEKGKRLLEENKQEMSDICLDCDCCLRYKKSLCHRCFERFFYLESSKRMDIPLDDPLESFDLNV